MIDVNAMLDCVPPSALRHRVLVVDDEERLRKVVVRVLRDAGIDADAAASGADASLPSGERDTVSAPSDRPGPGTTPPCSPIRTG